MALTHGRRRENTRRTNTSHAFEIKSQFIRGPYSRCAMNWIPSDRLKLLRQSTGSRNQFPAPTRQHRRRRATRSRKHGEFNQTIRRLAINPPAKRSAYTLRTVVCHCAFIRKRALAARQSVNPRDWRPLRLSGQLESDSGADADGIAMLTHVNKGRSSDVPTLHFLRSPTAGRISHSFDASISDQVEQEGSAALSSVCGPSYGNGLQAVTTNTHSRLKVRLALKCIRTTIDFAVLRLGLAGFRCDLALVSDSSLSWIAFRRKAG